MDKRIGEIFFMDIVKGSTKGHHTKGDNYLSSQYGPNTGEDYSDDRVVNETVGTGDGSDTTFSSVLAWSPAKSTYNEGSYKAVLTYAISGTEHTATMNSSNVITGTGISAGTYTPSTKTVDLTFSTAPDNGTPILISYDYDSTTVGAGSDTGLPEVDIKLTSALAHAFANSAQVVT